MLRNVVDEHKQTFDKNQLRDFIDAFLKETEESKNEDFSVILRPIQTQHFTCHRMHDYRKNYCSGRPALPVRSRSLCGWYRNYFKYIILGPSLHATLP